MAGPKTDEAVISLKADGYVISGKLYVLEADCRRAVNDALKVGKEDLIASHDELVAALRSIIDGVGCQPGYINTVGLARARTALAKAEG